MKYGWAPGNWLSWELGEAAGKGKWEAYGDICRLYMLRLFRKNSLHFRSTYFSVHMLYFTLKNSIKAKQNKTPGWEAKPKPGAASKEFHSRRLPRLQATAGMGDRAGGAGGHVDASTSSD